MSIPRSPSCYHCGLPVPVGFDLDVVVAGGVRSFCCYGCQAIAQAIDQGGLADYYRHRDGLPEAGPSTAEDMARALDEFRLFDHAGVQARFVRLVGAGDEREASLMLEGITCSACVWLIEQTLSRLPGVTGVMVNYATRRARVRWDRRLLLSQILAAVAGVGYRAHPYDPGRFETMARAERRDALWRLFVAGFGAMQVMMYAVPAYLAGTGEMGREYEQLMRWASLVLTLPVILFSAVPFFRNALRDIRRRRLGMDVPVALGVLVGFGASVWATVAEAGTVYFDSVSMFVFLLLAGRYLEMRARSKAVAVSEAMARQMPTLANRLPDYPRSMDCVRVAAGDLVVDDTVLVKPGEVIPADGVVIEGSGDVDESLLTGESMPQVKAPGDALTGGAVNGAGPLLMRVERAGEETRLASILALIDRAASERPQGVVLADRVAGHFVAVILLLALCAGTIWWFVEPERAVWVAVAVLVVTCPCALSLATPVALTVVQGALARRGFLVTRGHAVETLARVDHVIFDKTGTLTLGGEGCVEVFPLADVAAEDCLRLAATVESVSGHPLARAICRAAGALPAYEMTGFRVETGQGIEAEIDGMRLRIGTARFVAALRFGDQAFAPDVPPGLGRTVYLGSPQGWLAAFRVADALRPGAVEAVDALVRCGVSVTILSGDAETSVAAVAHSLGIDSYRAACSPAEKLAFVDELLARGKTVAMVGDGINDTPGLAKAQVSMAMGGGADLAKVQADCIVLGDRLATVVDAVRMSRMTLRVIRQNLFWALAYNAAVIPLAVVGWVSPWMAALGMSASSLLVVLNALRLRQREPKFLWNVSG